MVTKKFLSKEIYRRGADRGLRMGIYLAVLFAMMVGSLYVPMLVIAVFAMMVLVPMIAYRWVLKLRVESDFTASFSDLWTYGSMIFLCGSLVSGALILIYLRWINPDYLAQLYSPEAIETMMTSLQSSQGGIDGWMSEALNDMKESDVMPTATSFAMSWIWAGMFSGAMLSFVVGALAMLRKKPVNPADGFSGGSVDERNGDSGDGPYDNSNENKL